MAKSMSVFQKASALITWAKMKSKSPYLPVVISKRYGRIMKSTIQCEVTISQIPMSCDNEYRFFRSSPHSQKNNATQIPKNGECVSGERWKASMLPSARKSPKKKSMSAKFASMIAKRGLTFTFFAIAAPTNPCPRGRAMI